MWAVIKIHLCKPKTNSVSHFLIRVCNIHKSKEAINRAGTLVQTDIHSIRENFRTHFDYQILLLVVATTWEYQKKATIFSTS